MIQDEEGVSMIKIDELSIKPIYEQIYDEFVKLIVLGVLKEDDKLPSVRELAMTLQINPNTIQKAYKILESKRFINSVKGKGNFVSNNSETFDYYKKILEKNMTDAIKEMLNIGVQKQDIIKLIDTVMKEMVDYA